jgi:hypothetical protein
MNRFDDAPYDRLDVSADDRRRGGGPGTAVIVGIVVVVLAALVGGYLYNRNRTAKPEAAPATTAAEAAPAAAAPAAQEAAELPTLDASDGVARELGAAISEHPQLVSWLDHDNLVRRFVASTLNLAEGTSPASHVPFLAPGTGFQVEEIDGRTFVDPASFRRYDTVTDVLVSIDATAAASVFRRLHPLLEAAYVEVGDPQRTFDDALADAVGRLVSVPIPAPPIEVIPQDGTFHYADRELEQRTAAEKHLLRLGPDNARSVQAKLTELAVAAGIPLP